MIHITYDTNLFSVIEKPAGSGSFVGVAADGNAVTPNCSCERQAHLELMKKAPNVHPEPQYQAEISSDQKVLWVHSFADGSCVGRIGRLGVDIHNSVTDMANGMGQCKHCTHGILKHDEWMFFREYALKNWSIYLEPDLLLLPETAEV